jgi:hypothetical protein
MGDVGLDDSRVDSQAPGTNQLATARLVSQCPVELVDHIGAHPAGDLDQRGRVRHRIGEPDATEPPPGDRVRHLLDHGLVAETPGELEVHEAQVGLERDRGPAKGRVEVLAVRGEERLVVEEGVDGGKLGGQSLELVREERIEQVQLRGGAAGAKHGPSWRCDLHQCDSRLLKA